MQRTTVLLLFGGESAEHEVSIASARNVFAALDDEKFDVKLGFIDKTGRWWLLPTLEQVVSTHGHPQLVPVLGTGQLTTLPETTTLQPDVILPILHGTNGEDGTVQGLAKLLHTPIVGNSVTASAVCMDKDLTKKLLSQAGLPVVAGEALYSFKKYPQYNELSKKFGSTLFVKPANLGSSVGVYKVNNEEELQSALKNAFSYGDKVLIEKAVNARELEVAVLGQKNDIKISGVGEIKPDGDFYSYESKYDISSKSQIIIPAELSPEIINTIQEHARQAFTTVEGAGMARIDFFLEGEDTLYINEINTIPGFTNISMYSKLWREQGINYPDLVEELIRIVL